MHDTVAGIPAMSQQRKPDWDLDVLPTSSICMMLGVGRRTMSYYTKILADSLTAYHSGLAQLTGCLWHLSPESRLRLTRSLQGLVVSAQPVVHTKNKILCFAQAWKKKSSQGQRKTQCFNDTASARVNAAVRCITWCSLQKYSHAE